MVATNGMPSPPGPEGFPALLVTSRSTLHVFRRDRPGRHPFHLQGSVSVAAQAGSCLLNFTEVWHCRSPNDTDQPRRIVCPHP